MISQLWSFKNADTRIQMIAWTNKYYSMVRTSWTIMTSFKLFLFFVCIFVCLFCCFFCLVVCFSIVYAFVYFKCTIKAKYRLSFTRRTVKNIHLKQPHFVFITELSFFTIISQLTPRIYRSIYTAFRLITELTFLYINHISSLLMNSLT